LRTIGGIGDWYRKGKTWNIREHVWKKEVISRGEFSDQRVLANDERPADSKAIVFLKF
jgi:hypothetical protein